MASQHANEAQADRLDAFWDELVINGAALTTLSDETFFDDLAMVERLHAATPQVNPDALTRMRHNIFGSGQYTARQTAPTPAIPPIRLPVQQSRSGRWAAALSLIAAAALVVAGVTWLYSQHRGPFAPDDGAEVIMPAQAISTPGETPERMGAPLPEAGTTLGVTWRLPAVGGPVHNATAVISGEILARASASDAFTGLEGIDPGTGQVRWQSNLEWTGAALAADDSRVYILAGNAIVAIISADGTEAWTTTLDAQPQQIVTAGEALFVWDGDRMQALSTLSGDQLWVAQAADAGDEAVDEDGMVNAPVVSGDVVVAVTADGLVAGFDQSTGDPLWNLTGYAANETTLTVAGNGTVLAYGPRVDENGDARREGQVTLTAVEPDTGAILWEAVALSTKQGLAMTDAGVAVLADFIVQISSASAYTEESPPEGALEEDRTGAPLRVYVLDVATGSMVWTEENLALVSDEGHPPFSGLAAAADGTSVLALSEQGDITAISVSDMSVTSIVDVGQPVTRIDYSPSGLPIALLQDGSLAGLDGAILRGEGSLTAQSISDPAPLVDWTLPFTLDDPFSRSSEVLVVDGTIYRSIETESGSRWIEAVHAATGQVVWQAETDWTDHGFVGGSTGVFFADSTNQLIALDAVSGQPRWHLDFGGVTITGLALEDKLYVTDEMNGLSALDPETGEIEWTVQVGDEPDAVTEAESGPSPMFVGDYLLILDGDGVLHAVDRMSGGLAWSTGGFDPAQTRLTWQEGIVLVVTSTQEGRLSATGLELESGGALWTVGLTGTLFQPVATNETYFYLIADEVTQLSSLDAIYDPLEDVADVSSVEWPSSGQSSAGGGSHIVALDARSGEVLWTRSTASGGFIQLGTIFPNSGGLSALTVDGQMIWLGRESGSISGVNDLVLELGDAPVQIVESHVSGGGRFAIMPDGTLINFGSTPFNRMG